MDRAIADNHLLIAATEWFGSGRRVPYDPTHHRILTADGDLTAPHLMVFERVVGAPDASGRWITLLPGYPDGSYGYAKVDAVLGDARNELAPRLYVEYIGQGTRISPGIMPTRPSSAPTWWKRNGKRMTCGAPSWQQSTTPRSSYSSCLRANKNASHAASRSPPASSLC